jgi:uncharacterized protein DUF6515
MRLLGCLIAVVSISFFQSPWVHAQSADEHSSAEQSEPPHQHVDNHRGHDHVYPDRGTIYRELPKGAIAVHHAGLSYRFSDGVWLEPRGQAFIVVAPAIGAVVSALPTFATQFQNSGESYLYANDVYYRARPDLGGYEVVNDPDEEIPPATAAGAAQPPSAAAGTPVASAPALVTGAPIPAAAPAAMPAAASLAAPTAVPAAAPTAAAASAPVAAAAPSAAAALSSTAPRVTKVVAYPKNGQTPDVQARDHYECYKFAVSQSGFDPMHWGAAAAAQITEQQTDYERAQSACFEGRGYTVH